jgi:hypothetical protein
MSNKTISRPPQSHETIPLIVKMKKLLQILVCGQNHVRFGAQCVGLKKFRSNTIQAVLQCAINIRKCFHLDFLLAIANLICVCVV